MSDKDAPLDKCLLEILVYLETLGCNIQKRTQNLIEKRINKNYLSSPESIQKVVEKINLICDLSKASIDKVQNGVKKTVESHLKSTNLDSSDALDRVSLDGRESGQLSEKILKKPPTSRSLEDSARKEITLPKVKTEQNKNLKKVVYEDNTLFINENIILDDYLRCSVKLNWFPLEYFDKYKEVEADDILEEFEDSKKRVNEHVHSKKIKSYSGSSKESNVIDKSETSKSCSSKYKSSKKARVSESESDKAIMKKRNMKSTEESSDYEDTERSAGKKQDENYYKTEERDERGLSKPEGESESTREYSQEIELDFLMKGDEGVGSNKIENVDSNIDTVIGDKKVKEDPEDLGIAENKTTSPNKKKTPHSRSKEKRNKRKIGDQSDEKLNESSENNKEPKSKNERADKSCKRNRDKSEGNSSKEEKRKESQRECHKEKSDKSEYHDKSDENSNKVCIDKSKDVSKENHKGKSDKSDRKKYTHKSKKPFKRIICDSSGSEDEKNDKDDISKDVLQEKEACKNTLKVEHALDSVLFEKENVENDSGVENNAAIFNAKVDSPECSNSSSNDIQKKIENKESDKNLNVSEDSPSTQCNIDIVESLSRTAKGDDELVVQSCESLNEAEISAPCDPEDQIENRYNGETSKVLENKKSNVTEGSLHSNENRSNTELPSEDKSEDNSESEHSNVVDFDRFSEDSNDLLSKAETRSKKKLNSKLETKKVNKQGSTSINEFCEFGEENMNKTNKESNADKECEENAESISASAHSEKVSDATLAVDDNIINNVNASDDQCDKENEPELGVEKCASGTCNKEIESNLNVPDVQCNKETEPDIDVELDALGTFNKETESYLDVSDVQYNEESQPKNTETEPNHGNEPESNSIAVIEHKLDTETESKPEAENELKSDETESQPETKNDLKLDEDAKSKPAAETKLKNDEADSQSSENIEECQTSDQPKESKESSPIIPLIRCVNIQNLLDPSKNVSNDKSQDLPAKKPKMVTFFDKPIQITNRKNVSEKPLVNFTKKPSSILLKTKVTYASETRLSHDKVEIISSDSDSDISSTTRELMKRIKSNILDGNCNVYVSLTRDPIHSSVYTNSLTDIGINKVYNESGDLCSKDKVKELNENAKRAVLNSSSSDSDQDAPESTKLTKKSTNSSFSSDIEFSDKNESFSTHKKTKKFSKKRHKKHIHSDSDTEINNLTSLPKKRKKMSKMNTSDESSSNKDKQMTDTDESEDEMGRSLRLKGRTEQAALPDQSTQDRNGSDSSSSSKVEDSKKKSKEDSTLLDTMLNGNLKSEMASDAEHSSESGSGGKSKSKTFSGKPILESIKNDLLEDETSSSARESPPKINGKDKGGKQFKEEDESDEEDPGSQEDRDKSDSDSDNISKKRSNSVIDLNSESDDSDVKPKRKGKKTQQNGKGSNSDDGDDKAASGSNTDESEIFVSSKRKRKQKKKSSDESSDDSKKSETSMKKRRRIKKLSGDESSAESGSDSDGETRKGGRKNIRALKKSSHLDSATRIAARKERERIARITERQKLYNESMFDESGRPDEVVKLDKVVLDFDPKTKEPSISVDKGLVEKLKPHQANGIKFMWDACFESVKQIKESKGSGCILAHCMGLGKTLQVVTLTHTLLTHQDHTKVERVLVVCPLSTVLNWVNEFRMWLEHSHAEDEINIFELSKYKQNYERSNQLKEWLECGGVCILGYDMFRNLSADNPKKFRKAQLSAFQKALVDPGPDLVVCDEGHLLKNEKTSLSQSMNRIKTLRRIVLTGTPLQNNLKEYYCMVQFVKPNLLGKYNEYLNRFVNPITNGQYTNSTEHDIRVMKRRSHVLHKMLDGAVQRRDYAVLAPFLPPKHEYVLFISLTEIQIKLYAHYLENYSRRPNPDRKTTPSLFSDFQSLQRIWTHPLVLKANSERYELMQQKKRDKEEEDDSEGSLADFIDDEEDTTTPEETSASESVDSDDSDDNRKKKKSDKKGKNSKTKHSRLTRATAGTKGDDQNIDDDIVELKTEEPTRAENPTEWWMSLCSEEELNDVKHSNKLLILLDILKMCDAIGDKLLVFSQSLYSLDLIEQFLSKIDESTQKTEKDDDHLAGHVGSWASGLDYFRLDGSTSCENRAIWCKAFNREDNPRARLFLISTRAGGLGINLVAANRVVIFDMSWNPSHDVQSIFRVYRFGQKKPCYIYRFLALGTMEEKIYERQVTKQAISKRVIDEQQIDRHYTESDLAELYIFNPVPEGPREVPNLPKDRLFADLLKQHDTVIYKYHEHDSLLENKEEETLTEEERKAAWDDYENEKTKPPPAVGNSWLVNFQQQQQQQQMTINALSAVLRQDYPTLSEQQITTMIPSILQQMYSNGDASLMQKMSAMMAAQSNMMGGQNSMMTGFKYPQNILPQGMMMNPGTMGVSMRGGPMYQQAAWQQQQQLQLQRLQQQQAMQANLKYYAGGLGSRDMIDMAALQQQQRALLLSSSVAGQGTTGTGTTGRGRPSKQHQSRLPQEVVDLDSE